jgi:hypothetical protein
MHLVPETTSVNMLVNPQALSSTYPVLFEFFIPSSIWAIRALHITEKPWKRWKAIFR